ncbi:Uma2 family endonuclease [Streptomyces sp. AN091965]|uniref:Uma2 family endonuclease n=1 Tax=Streptomyces sp. AN091965 TaxID=2927803 RepID=UPI001F6142BB|nr:Uma2 family endonuclease [Streptomyces sp. AN091965]MCI3931334.1 Uma2 family endonuclease [Streptomyces sp. AN091965]
MTVLDRLWRDVEAQTNIEGFVVEIIDGKVIMTPQSPAQSNTILNVVMQAHTILRGAPIVFDVGIDFPGETSTAPDITILDEDAEPRGKRYICQDVIAAIEVVSTESDDNDYVTKVAKYSRFGIETYLILDPFKKLCTLYEGSGATGYRKKTEYPYGATVDLALSDGRKFSLDTSGFPVED